MKLKYHRTLTEEKWAQFPFYKQLIMIANELNRAKHWIVKGDAEETRNCYDRAFELIYLTIAVSAGKNVLRELARFKEAFADMYVNKRMDLEANQQLFRVLLSLDKDSYNLLLKDTRAPVVQPG